MKNTFLIFGLLLVVVFGLGCVGKGTQTSTKGTLSAGERQSGEPSPEIGADLSMSGMPSLGQVVELTFGSKSHVDAENVTMEIFLPEGFFLINGNLSFEGEIPIQKEVRIKSSVKAVKTGMWEIRARVINYRKFKDFENREIISNFTNLDYLYINVSENSAQVSYLPFKTTTQGKEKPLDKLYTIKLGISETPYIDKPVDLAVEVMPVSDSPDFSIGILLPEGIELVKGDLTPAEEGLIRNIQGPVANGDKVQLNATIKVVKEGYWGIKSAVGRDLNGTFYKQSSYLYINTSSGEVTVSEISLQRPQQNDLTNAGTRIT